MFGKSIENRILVGVTSFVGIMVLVGWIAINEGGRMLAFDRQFNARSIERGAALFATNCATCHGTDARGIEGRAPALNNPQLFGHDFVGQIDTQIEALTAELAALETELAEQSPSEERIAEINARLGVGSIAFEQYEAVRAAEAAAQEAEEAEDSSDLTEAPAAEEAGAQPDVTATPSLETQVETAAETVTGEMPPLEAEVETAAESVGLAAPAQVFQAEQTAMEEELTALQTELATEGLAETRANEINARIAEISARLGGDSIPAQILDLQTQRTTVLNSLTPTLDKGYNPDEPSRLDQLGWAGSLESFIYTTLVHGRPVSRQYWPAGESMPPWSQTAGGPLRNDQLQDLTNYILNFDKGVNWTLEDLFAVNQFAIVPGATAGTIVPEGPRVCPDPAACDVAAVTAELVTLTADLQRGEQIYRQQACVGCHVTSGGVIAPALEGTWTRVIEERLTLPQFAGYSGEQYLVESILLPIVYTVPPYAGVMPTDFGNKLDIQMLADLVAYLQSQDGPSPE